MPSGEGRWAELSSQHERVIWRAEPASGPALPAQPEWADLASNRERLLDASDPDFELARHSRGGTGMRLVTGAA
jgi:hypothetical protein